MIELLREILTHPTLLLVGAVTVIEIVPIKINPWKTLFHWIGNCINGELKESLSEMKRDFEETKAQDKTSSELLRLEPTLTLPLTQRRQESLALRVSASAVPSICSSRQTESLHSVR